MKKLLLVLVSFVFVACGKSEVVEVERLNIGTTIFPIYDIASEIAGDKADVFQIVPAGASPHTFELTPQLVAEVADADMVFAIGLGLDDFAHDLVHDNADLSIFSLEHGVNLLGFEEEEHEDEHEDEHGHGEFDPHYWLSAYNGKAMAAQIAEELMVADPANETYYVENLRNFQKEVDAKVAELEVLLSDLEKEPELIVFHDAWGYFAKEFGMEIIGHFANEPGKDPTAQDLAALYDLAKEHEVKVVFSEPQLSPDGIRPFVEDLGLELEVLDPIGGEGLEGREGYLELLEYNVRKIHEAMRK